MKDEIKKEEGSDERRDKIEYKKEESDNRRDKNRR